MFETIRAIERAAAQAWPALHAEKLGGWRLRYSQGVTRRANSVWPNEFDEDGMDLAERLHRVEMCYAARGLPARYQLCPAALPAGLDAALASRGYASVAETAVMTAPVDELRAALACDSPWQVRLTPSVDGPWIALYAAVEQVPELEAAVRRAILETISAPAAYVTVWAGDEAVAGGSAVWSGDYVGLFNIGTRPLWRRRGAAQAAMAALLQWAAQRGAETTYLQVMVQNAPARALYERLGYTELYRYYYRERARA